MSAMDTEQAQKGIVPIGEHIELAITDDDLAYNDEEKEPVLHARTYIAVFAMFVQTLVCQLALQGPLLIVRLPMRDVSLAPVSFEETHKSPPLVVDARHAPGQPTGPDLDPQRVLSCPGRPVPHLCVWI